MKPAKKRNSRLFSMLCKLSPWLEIFLYISSLSLSFQSSSSSVSATAVEIASSCCLAKSLDRCIGTAANRCWILPGMHCRRRTNFSWAFLVCRYLPWLPLFCPSSPVVSQRIFLHQVELPTDYILGRDLYKLQCAPGVHLVSVPYVSHSLHIHTALSCLPSHSRRCQLIEAIHLQYRIVSPGTPGCCQYW
jgi:hypothetical protein